MPFRRLAIGIPVAAALLVGSVGAGATLNPRQLILQLSDLPPAFTVSSGGDMTAQTFAKLGLGTALGETGMARIASRTFVDGYWRVYANSHPLHGAATVATMVLVWRTRKDAALAGDDCSGNGDHVRPIVAAVGDKTTLCESTHLFGPGDSLSFNSYTVEWRRGLVGAEVVVSGLPGQVSARQATALAQAQDARMFLTLSPGSAHRLGAGPKKKPPNPLIA